MLHQKSKGIWIINTSFANVHKLEYLGKTITNCMDMIKLRGI